MNMPEHRSPYILVTAARNEAKHIRITIESVIAQTLRPSRWIIVSDGSTDDTDLIIREFAEHHPFIELLALNQASERTFASKAAAVNSGYDRVRHLDHALIGVLDADVSFATDYYAQVVERFNHDPQLGLAGGVLIDLVDGNPVPQITNPDWSVSGPIQMFRKECFDAIGGYLPLRGGIDAAAEVMTRMNGWTVHAFPELKVLHHRQTGTEKHHNWATRSFHQGLEDNLLGYHPLFLMARSINHFRAKPYVFGGLASICGYAWAGLTRMPKKVSPEFIRYLRTEQLGRLRACFRLPQEGPG